jgi:hypothetical protein
MLRKTMKETLLKRTKRVGEARNDWRINGVKDGSRGKMEYGR